ncbi:hypothetical protein [Micromonospora sp. NPDC047730]|uniref:hypothetical protein n=1 Tax=Micromonospora sp. NPDC047730 TaxID=3364253 RepID=UPI0037114D51
MTEDKRPVTADSTPAEIDQRLLGLAWDKAHHQAILGGRNVSEEQRAAAEEALARIADEENPLEAAYERRRWTRWWWVPNGHLHREGECSTLFESTERNLTPRASGLSDEELVGKFGWHVCTACYPDAPKDPNFRTPGTYAAEQAAADGWCLNKVPARMSRRWHGYGSCGECDAGGVPVSSRGNLRKHKHQRMADDAAREARINDPKLIGAATGEPLKVDGSEIRTRRTAEIEWVRHMENGDERGWASNRAWQAEQREFARQIAEALAAKDGVSVEEIEARLQPKLEAKIRKFERDRETAGR